MADSTQKKLKCIVVTPEQTVLDESVDFVALPLYDGELGVLPGRAPLVARLGYGEMRTFTGDILARYYIDGGFLQIRDDAVSILTPRAIPAEKIDPATARSEIERVNEQVPTRPEDFQAKTIALTRARGQLQVARRAGKS